MDWRPANSAFAGGRSLPAVNAAQGKGMDWQQRKGSISAAFFALGKGSAAAVNPAAHSGRPTLPRAVYRRPFFAQGKAREWIGSSAAAAGQICPGQGMGKEWNGGGQSW